MMAAEGGVWTVTRSDGGNRVRVFVCFLLVISLWLVCPLQEDTSKIEKQWASSCKFKTFSCLQCSRIPTVRDHHYKKCTSYLLGSISEGASPSPVPMGYDSLVLFGSHFIGAFIFSCSFHN